ncbi:hypothetical protein Pcinc_041746 [Petrolisthes cinctipes]|uniref:Uncharacterized protein n=1 Tax=Petrolisthes cinctipes TaxID=88211 RepID=A0AAE1BIX4_PETCI|nr:hypothetical protein Pcinc_041746 [Petrolisthes cinctipes]
MEVVKVYGQNIRVRFQEEEKEEEDRPRVCVPLFHRWVCPTAPSDWLSQPRPVSHPQCVTKLLLVLWRRSRSCKVCRPSLLHIQHSLVHTRSFFPRVTTSPNDIYNELFQHDWTVKITLVCARNVEGGEEKEI